MRSTKVVAALLSSLALAPYAEGQTNANNEVMQAMETIRAASLARDVAQLDAVMADDCTLVLFSGRLITKPQYLSAVGGGSVEFDSLTYEDVSIRIYGNTVVVTNIVNIKERIAGIAMSGRYRSTRVLVKSEAGWRFVALQSTGM